MPLWVSCSDALLAPGQEMLGMHEKHSQVVHVESCSLQIGGSGQFEAVSTYTNWTNACPLNHH